MPFRKLPGIRGLGACSGVGGDTGLQHLLGGSFCAGHKYLLAPRSQPRLRPPWDCAILGPSGGQASGRGAGACHPGGFHCVSGGLEQLTGPSTYPLQPPSPQGWHRDHLSDCCASSGLALWGQGRAQCRSPRALKEGAAAGSSLSKGLFRSAWKNREPSGGHYQEP